MYTFDEKFKKGAARAFRAQQGLTAFLSGLNRILPEPPDLKRKKRKMSAKIQYASRTLPATAGISASPSGA